MIMFDRFSVICDECGGDCSVGVTSTFDGDAVVVAQCNECNEIEKIQTEISEVE